LIDGTRHGSAIFLLFARGTEAVAPKGYKRKARPAGVRYPPSGGLRSIPARPYLDFVIQYCKLGGTKNMNAVLETSRLLLRELTLDDAEKLSLVLSDPISMRYYPEAFSTEKVRRWILWNVDNYRAHGFGLWAVILKEENELIGDCGITLQNIEGELVPEIGYHIRNTYCGKGYASEAAKACIDFAFGTAGYDAVYSYMKEDNISSRRVAEKIGMTFVRCFQKIIDGHTITEALYMIEK